MGFFSELDFIKFCLNVQSLNRFCKLKKKKKKLFPKRKVLKINIIQKNNYHPNFYLQHLSAYLPLRLLDHNYQQQHHVLSFSLSLHHRIIFIKSSGSTIKMLCYLMKKQFSLFIHNKSSDWAVLSLLIPHPGKNHPPVGSKEQLVTLRLQQALTARGHTPALGGWRLRQQEILIAQ